LFEKKVAAPIVRGFADIFGGVQKSCMGSFGRVEKNCKI